VPQLLIRIAGATESAAYEARCRGRETSGNSFEVWHGRRKVASVALCVPGRHNVLNALASFAALSELGMDAEQIVPPWAPSASGAPLPTQRGAGRGDWVDDYAHHPTELLATLRAAREGKWSRVIAVFQPHLYSGPSSFTPSSQKLFWRRMWPS